MWKWLIAQSFVHNLVNDTIRGACYSAGAYALAHGFVTSKTENDLIGALFFLGTAAWQYVENRVQAQSKAQLIAQVAGKAPDAGNAG